MARIKEDQHMNDTTPLTKQALSTLGMDALDKTRAGQIVISPTAGGVSFASAMEVMEFAKLMSIADKAVPKHLRNNPGICLAVTFQAIEWRMSPFAVANKSYEVNDRLAFESQLIHAVIETRAPLRERLSCRYDGDGADRKCTITGKFSDGTERDYSTPAFKDIRVKNSPLWRDDPDQQQFYYASRAWARKWCPDVLLGIYTREELAHTPNFGREEDGEIQTNGLRSRLIESKPGDEGHQDGHAERELAAMKGEHDKIRPAVVEVQEIIKPEKKKRGRPKTKVEEPTKESAAKASEPNSPQAIADNIEKMPSAGKVDPGPQPQSTEPKSAMEYIKYAERWVDASASYEDAHGRWDGEREMRETLGVAVRERNKLVERMHSKFNIEAK